MPVSIITRAYKTSELKNLIENLNLDNEIEKEIIAVCNVYDYKPENTKLIIENSNRFEARISGIRISKHDRVLFLDSDQIPEMGLLSELDRTEKAMVVIPERSISDNFTSRCLDDWRLRNETLASKKFTPYIPVIPRFYAKKYLINAIENITSDVVKIIDHEDSILYFYIYQETMDVGICKKHIYNNDPNFINLMRKAFLYGRNNANIKNLNIPEEISYLLYELNINTLNVKNLGFGKGYVIQTLRSLSYELGRIFTHLKG